MKITKSAIIILQCTSMTSALGWNKLKVKDKRDISKICLHRGYRWLWTDSTPKWNHWRPINITTQLVSRFRSLSYTFTVHFSYDFICIYFMFYIFLYIYLPLLFYLLYSYIDLCAFNSFPILAFVVDFFFSRHISFENWRIIETT